MRLLRLTLENWRGIDEQDIRLAPGITLVEGPNEIGKSTLIEALRMLIKEKDSSNRRAIKSVQPAGQDVGSRVEAEIKIGAYQFVYAKTFNKAKQTTLDISAPSPQQITGREAHETVEKILQESVDMSLWDALLVDQGAEVALANLQDSTSLAKALDQAVGTTTAYTGQNKQREGGEEFTPGNNDETNLYLTVQAEYEQYYTLKTGKEKFSSLIDACNKAEITLETAKRDFDAVEANRIDFDICTANVNRLKEALPTIKASQIELDRSWKELNALKEVIATKETECSVAHELQLAAENSWNTRQELIISNSQAQVSVDAKNNEQRPLQIQTKELGEQVERQNQNVSLLKKQASSAKQIFEQSQLDEHHLLNMEQLSQEKGRLARLVKITETLTPYLELTRSISIDQSALDLFREAESRLLVTQTKKSSAITTISITARQPLSLKIDDDSISLGTADTETREVSSKVHVQIPDIADIRVIPPQSVVELQEETDDAQANLAGLSSRFGVQDYAAAVRAHEQRVHAQREVDRLTTQEREILKATNREAIEQSIKALQKDSEQTIQRRKTATPLPESLREATEKRSQAQNKNQAADRSLEVAREALEETQKAFSLLDNQLRTGEQELAGLAAALQDKQKGLEGNRSQVSDDKLEKEALDAALRAGRLVTDLNQLKQTLSDASPEALEERLRNALDVMTRATQELTDEEQRLAVLSDRLRNAQADGRFEMFDAAQRNVEHTQEQLAETRKRAQAAELLWITLTKHRDAAREAYVRPLKDAIETLGAIVFGSGFSVAINDDWSIASRTLNGKTIAFEDLSVGTKEQLGILLRLAAAQLVSNEGGVPLIIDDALGFSDPQRLAAMGAAIAAAGKHCQIIILTCTPGRFTHVGNAHVVKFGIQA